MDHSRYVHTVHALPSYFRLLTPTLLPLLIGFVVATVAHANTDKQPAALHIIAKVTDRHAAQMLYRQTLLANQFDQVRLLQGPLTVRTLSLGVYADEATATRIVAQLQAADVRAALRATASPPGFIVDVISAFDDRTFDESFLRVNELGYRKEILITTAALDDDVFFIMGATRPPPVVVAQVETPQALESTPAVAYTPMPIRPKKAEFSPWQWLRLLDPIALHSLAAQGEFDHWSDSGVAAAGSYFSTDLALKWRWTETTEFFFGGRIDMYEQTGTRSFQQLTTDYDSTFWRWQHDGQRLTLGQQKLIFGPDDRDSLSNKLIVKDMSRALIESSVQRKTWPSLAARWEYDQEGLRLDMAAIPLFESAKLAHYDSMWSPINSVNGRLLNRRTPGVLGDVIKGSTVGSQRPAYGGAGLQVSYTESEIRHALALQYVADSEPYIALTEAAGAMLRGGGSAAAALAAASGQAFVALHPEQWILTYSESFRTWRFELALLDKVPVTGTDYRTKAVQAVDWLFGADFYTPDPGTTVYLALNGRRLGAPADILDRTQPTRIDGNVKKSFIELPWRIDFRFTAGLDTYEFHLAPTVTYTGTRQFEVSIGGHYFYGDTYTEAGYHNNQNLLTLGWQTRF
ncbi:MAG: hypothetical protein AABY83_08270 [Pseudomonadota bacterium]